MKKIFKLVIAALMVTSLFSFASCAKEEPPAQVELGKLTKEDLQGDWTLEFRIDGYENKDGTITDQHMESSYRWNIKIDGDKVTSDKELKIKAWEGHNLAEEQSLGKEISFEDFSKNILADIDRSIAAANAPDLKSATGDENIYAYKTDNGYKADISCSAAENGVQTKSIKVKFELIKK